MAKGAFSPDFLNEVIDGRVLAGPAHGEVAALARLARSCGRLADAGPDPAAMDRMLVRFRGHLRDEGSQPAAAWLAGWAGLGARPRPLIQRLAAGSVLLVAAGGGATEVNALPGTPISGVCRPGSETGPSARAVPAPWDIVMTSALMTTSSRKTRPKRTREVDRFISTPNDRHGEDMGQFALVPYYKSSTWKDA